MQVHGIKTLISVYMFFHVAMMCFTSVASNGDEGTLTTRRLDIPTIWYVGCFQDSKQNRLMTRKTRRGTMSAQICREICWGPDIDPKIYNYFGLQFGRECWCGTDPEYEANGPELDESDCDYPCRNTEDEYCGGFDRMTIYNYNVG